MDHVPQSDRCTVSSLFRSGSRSQEDTVDIEIQCEPKYEFEGKEYPPKAASHAGGLAGMVKSWLSGSGSAETKKEEL